MKATGLDAVLSNYIENTSQREHPVLNALRAKTKSLPGSGMQISTTQGQLLSILLKLMSAKTVLEIGTYTGYSALAMALALPADGMVTSCDINEQYTTIGMDFWEQADVRHKIDFRLGNAQSTLDALIAENRSFDLAFIDADKRAQDDYYEKCLLLVRAGGLIIIDNVLWHGDVANENDSRESTKSIRALNKKIQADNRVESCFVAIGDGVLLLRKI